MRNNISYESEIRLNLETYDDVELMKKIKSGNLTQSAEKISITIIESRNSQKVGNLVAIAKKAEEEILKEAEEEIEIIKDKKLNIYKKLKLMNAIGVILWGFGLVTSITLLFLSLFSKNTNSLNYVLSIPVYGCIFLSPFYTWKVCHSENNRNLSSTAYGLNFGNFGLLVLSGVGVFINTEEVLHMNNNELISGFIGLAILIGIPSLINIVFLPKFEDGNKTIQ